jgi:hypothetical protein
MNLIDHKLYKLYREFLRVENKYKLVSLNLVSSSCIIISPYIIIPMLIFSSIMLGSAILSRVIPKLGLVYISNPTGYHQNSFIDKPCKIKIATDTIIIVSSNEAGSGVFKPEQIRFLTKRELISLI